MELDSAVELWGSVYTHASELSQPGVREPGYLYIHQLPSVGQGLLRVGPLAACTGKPTGKEITMLAVRSQMVGVK